MSYPGNAIKRTFSVDFVGNQHKFQIQRALHSGLIVVAGTQQANLEGNYNTARLHGCFYYEK